MTTPREERPAAEAEQQAQASLQTGPTVATAPPRSRWRLGSRPLPNHLGPARTSTVILAVLFVALFVLWQYVRPPSPTQAATTSGTGAANPPASTTAPAPATTTPPTPTATTAPSTRTTTPPPSSAVPSTTAGATRTPTSTPTGSSSPTATSSVPAFPTAPPTGSAPSS